MLALVGEIPAVERRYISAKDKSAGIKAESKLSKPPDVRFKTHKVAVKAQIPHLSPIVIAWAIDGYTTTSADNILLAISSSTKTKDHVKAQIIAAQEEQVKLPRNDLKLAIEKFGSLEALTFSISFGGIEQNGQAGSLRLIKELAPVWDRRL